MYNDEFKEQVVTAYLKQRRTLKSVADEYGISDSTVKAWLKEYRISTENDLKARQALAAIDENQKLRRKIEELEKENDFLKKAAAFFAKESRQ